MEGNHFGISEQDWTQIKSWNASCPQGVDFSVHDLIHLRTQFQPEAFAICAWDGKLTYRELDTVTSQLAIWLREKGVAHGSRVPLAFLKSKWAVIAMIAIWKAGGSFVPLDFTQPHHRLRQLLEDLSPDLILASESTKEKLPKCEVRVIIIDQGLLDRIPRNDLALRHHVNTADPALILFTSGSTGKPTGVIISHRAIATASIRIAPTYDYGPHSRVAQFSAYVWLVCANEIFTTLVWGGRVCIPSESQRLDDPARFIRDHKVTLIHTTPAFLSPISPVDVPSVRILGVGGDKIPPELTELWSRSVKVVLGYGSTETNLCINQIYNPINRDNTSGRATGAVAWIARSDDHNLLCPVGDVGDLLIESSSLAQEYLNEESRTTETFVTAPDWLRSLRPSSSSRLCRVGDLASYNKDGSIRLHGRKAAIVKIRGQRVDLQDVQHSLHQCLPSHVASIVEAVSPLDDANDLRLVAFLVVGELSSPSGQLLQYLGNEPRNKFNMLTMEVRQKLSKLLPSYMLPSTFLPISKIPLTSSGKIDRPQVRRIASELTAAQIVAVVAARDEPLLEPINSQGLALRALWSLVLKIPQQNISSSDDFLALGGHSLSAIHLVSLARKSKMFLTANMIFNNTRLSDMALASSRLQVSDTSDAISPYELIHDKTEMELLLDEISSSTSLEKRHVEDIYPCTNLQAGLMSLSMKHPGTYIVRSTMPITSSVDIEKFCEAWREVASKSPILRTRLVQTSVGLMQVVLHEDFDWTIGEEALRSDTGSLMSGDRLVHYNITDDPTRGKIFTWVVHHALLDAWSQKETLRLVESAYWGETVEVMPGFNGFIQYVLRAEKDDSTKKYWETQLEGVSPMNYPSLPALNYQPVGDSISRKNIFFKRATGSSFTTATIVRASWGILLSQYAHTSDVVFGATVSGRASPVANIEKIMGPTIATLPIRMLIDKDTTIKNLLLDVQTQAADMMLFEQYGLQNIRRLSSEINHACNFQTLLVTRTSDEDEEQEFLQQKLKLQSWKNSLTYALTLECALSEYGASCQATFDQHILHPAQVELLMSQLEQIIQQVCTESTETTIRAIDMFSNLDRQTLWQWNATMPPTIDMCAHDLFSRNVTAHPHSIAIDAWDGVLTYQELDRVSSQLSHYLHDVEDVGPEVIVPLCFQKSKWMIISMLALWKAGGAFASIDAAHPKAWIEMISRNVKTKLALCSEQVSGCFPDDTRVIVVDQRLLDQLTAFDSPPSSGVSPENVAYVIHTSGSTGVPKGIVHEHRTYVSGVVNRIPSMLRSRHARALQFASYSFDVSIEDIWTTLLVGGAVCVPSDYERINDLVNYMNRTKVNYAELTPSFTRTLRPELLPDLKVLSLSGEASTDTDRDLWASHLTLLDEYGPAEIAIKSHLKHKKEDSIASDKGQSVACLSWIVDVDNQDKLQIVGAIGELLLEGPILSRGYLNHPEKTKESYIENPVWLPREKYGSRRMFKTGDLARYNVDGTINILGRKDTQVKLRGHRIELGQIEHQARHILPPNIAVVAELVVLKGGNRNGNIVLFTCNDSPDGNLSQKDTADMVYRLSASLTNVLPAYMVPSALISLDTLPVNMSRKVDRLKLKELAKTVDEKQIRFFSSGRLETKRQPSTVAEREVRKLWAQVLETEETSIGVDDEFIRLGGDSILAMKMVAIASRKDDTPSLTVKDIFEYPVLSQMALAMEKAISKSLPRQPSTPFDCLNPCQSQEIQNEVARICNLASSSLQDIYPCSPLQEGLMALSIKTPGTYISRLVYDLPATTDIDRLKAAWAAVYETTPTLRTRIVQQDKQMLQTVVNETFTWTTTKELNEYIDTTSNIPMGLGDSLFRCAVVQTSPTSMSLVLVLHHAIYDGWSMGLLLERVRAAYENDLNVTPGEEFKLFIKYLISIDRDQHTDFWKNQMEGAADSSVLYPPLPSPNHQPKADSTSVYEMSIPSGLGRNITTIPNLLRAAWALLAAKCSDATDVVFGITLSGRNAPVSQINTILGPTFTTVPVRVKLDTSHKIKQFIEQIHIQATNMIAFEHLGLHSIQKIDLNTRAACEFRTLLVVQTVEEKGTSRFFSTKDQKKVQGDFSAFNPYAAMIQFIPLARDKFAVNMNFDSKILDHKEAHRLLRQLEHVLHQLCTSDPETRISKLSILTEADRVELLQMNNNAITPKPASGCIHDYIKEQTLRQPNKIAIDAWDGVFTYDELDQLSGALCHRLRAQGVGPEVIVPVCFEKSKWTAVAILGVLKAGGAFALLDPEHPIERLTRIIQDTKAEVMVSSKTLEQCFNGAVNLVLVVSEETADQTEDERSQSPAISRPCDLACLVFTSGSTGTPKGIMLEHSAVCTSALSHGPVFEVDEGSRVLQFASHAFDMAIYDFCTTLMLGGCVCIPSNHDKMNNLSIVINDFSVNWAFFTPSTVNMLIPEEIPSLKTLVVGGESVSQEIVEGWVNKVHLFQCSGPAETTTCLGGMMTTSTPKNCLGRGLGALPWVVDSSDHDVLLPMGVIGELVLEGPVLARAYLSEADNARGQFILNPKWTHGQANHIPAAEPRKFYKTGDLVKYAPDGSLLFVGRKDTQVKLRGQRLEVNEIEDCMRRHLNGSTVAVEVLRPLDGQRNMQLGAFISCPGSEFSKIVGSESKIGSSPTGWTDTVAQLKQYLSSCLPGYMVPTVYIPLANLPLNGSGKVDRKQLRQFGSSLTTQELATRTAVTNANRSPANAAEFKMQALWGTVLQIESLCISANDNFLHLGGDSITAMRLVAAARRAGVLMTVAQIFKFPVLCDMVSKSKVCNATDTMASLRPFELVSELGPLQSLRMTAANACSRLLKDVLDIVPCTPLQEGLMALSIGKPGAYVAQEVYRIKDDVDIERFKRACEAVVDAFPILRSHIVQLESSQMLQVVTNDGIEWSSSDNLDDYLSMDRNAPIQLGENLTRWCIVSSPSPHFVWTKHHSSYDGFSSSLVLDYIERAYGNILSFETEQPPSTTFSTFIKYLSSKNTDEQKEFWTSYLEGAGPAASLGSLSAARVSNPHASLRIEIATSRSLETSITFATIARAAWALVLGHYTNSNDVVFGATLSGRDLPLPGIESIVGPTFTTVPVRISLTPSSTTVNQYLDSVQADAIKMIPYEHFGLQNIKRISLEVANVCDFQTLLVLQPQSQTTENSLVAIQQADGYGAFRTYPLTVIFDMHPERSSVTGYFDPTWVNSYQVERMLHQFQHALEQLGTTGSQLLADLSLTPPQDVERVWGWNRAVPETSKECIHDVIACQMQTRPDSPAVHSWDSAFTYSLLDQYSSKLADKLKTHGIGGGNFVPVIFEKSAWTIVAILAILRAGAAFVPVDPALPATRVKYLIDRMDAPLVLTSARNISLCVRLQKDYLKVDEEYIREIPLGGHWIDTPAHPSDPAYVSFTSGSTGEPKGSVIQHQAYCSGAAAHIPKIAIDYNSRVLQFASYSFDTCFEDILTTLMVGGCICIPSESERVEDIEGAINHYDVNWAHLTPSVSSLISPDKVPRLKVLLLGGEAMTRRHIRQWTGKVRLINVYGPSELCVTCSISEHVNLEDPTNIGKPIGGVAWIVDPENHNELTPIGALGELLFEGPILAAGYLKDSSHTSAAFIEPPAWLRQGGHDIPGRVNRLYKTGDLVRYQEDGSLVFHGRKDNQVKLHGQRIELGEIEYQIKEALQDQQGLDVAVEMITTPQMIGTTSLVAFLALRDPPNTYIELSQIARFKALVAELKDYLAGVLPSFMIPSAFIPIAQIPLTTSKKVDRKRLQVLVSEFSPEELMNFSEVEGSSRLCPETALEKTIQQIWATVLNKALDKVNLTTTFWALGGDSIAALRVLSSLRQHNIPGTLFDVMQHKTIGSFCAALESGNKEYRNAGEVSTINSSTDGHTDISEVSSSSSSEDPVGSFPLSPIQERFFGIYPDGNPSYQLSHLLKASRPLSLEEMGKAFNLLLQKHAMLRARFHRKSSGRWEQSLSPPDEGSFLLHGHIISDIQELPSIIAKSCDSIDILSGRMLVIEVIETPQDCILFLTAHHLAVDLVSWRILLEDLESLLDQKSISFPRQMSLPYHVWCEKLAEIAQNMSDPDVLPFKIHATPFEYWGLSETAVHDGNFITESIVLDVDTSSEFYRWCATDLEVPPRNALLSTIVYSFAQIFLDRELPTIFNVSHGREMVDESLDVSRTVGWFTTMHPTKAIVDSDLDLRKSVKAFSAAFQDTQALVLPFFISRYLRPEGKQRLGAHDMMEMVFNYTGLYQQLESCTSLFKPLQVLEHDSSHREDKVKHSAMFEIIAHNQCGSLGLVFSYHPEIRHKDRIHQWIRKIHENLVDARSAKWA